MKERDKIPSAGGKQESAFSGRQIRFVEKVTLTVFCVQTSAEGTKYTGVSNLKPAVDNQQRRKSEKQVSFFYWWETG